MQYSGKWVRKATKDQDALIQWVRGSGAQLAQPWHWQNKTEQYCRARLDGAYGAQKTVVKVYTNGTLWIQSSDAQWFEALSAYLGGVPSGTKSSTPSSTTSATAGTPTAAYQPNPNVAWQLGSDESGKGDYFGPLVVAATALNAEHRAALKTLGVRDCKSLSNNEVLALAQDIMGLLGPNESGEAARYSTVCLMPATYNQWYAAFAKRGQKLNHLMADLHQRALTPLLGSLSPATTPMPAADLQVVVDAFERQGLVQRAILTHAKEQQISLSAGQLCVIPKAEDQAMAVAAASILARARFLSAMAELSATHQTSLPLGAGAPVLKAAKAWVRRHGADSLSQVAKVHFATTQQAL